ncbi:MAG: transcriptional repressor [Actinomycetales bacterium]|jgi:Fur family ferric uptake transcriptional regulator|nr:transcriptional repressor [Actinomycetales bacterium]
MGGGDRDGVRATGQRWVWDARAAGSRQTEQRRSVLEFLATVDRCLSAQEIRAALEDQGRPVSLATVYRTVARLARAGVLDVVLRDDGEATYVLGSARHHHHLVCRRCGSVAEIANPAVESWTVEVARLHGFADVDHRLTVTGVCPACRSVHQRVEGAGTS